MKRLVAPRVLFSIGVATLMCVIAAGIALYLEDRHDCRTEVRARDGQRTMWLYIADAFPDARFVVDMIIELNQRLPALECRGGDPVPIGE